EAPIPQLTYLSTCLIEPQIAVAEHSQLTEADGDERNNRRHTMRTTTLGRTGLEVSPIAFGTWQLGGDWGAFDESAAIDAIRNARELGINLFDTAQAYGFGASERLLGKALHDEIANRRDGLVIATKGGLRMTEDGQVRDSSPD